MMADVNNGNNTTIMDLLIKFDNRTYNPERYIKYIIGLYEARKESSISENSNNDHFMLLGSEVVIDKYKEINETLNDNIFTTVVDFLHNKKAYKIGDITEEYLVELMFATNVGMKKFLSLLYILFTGENHFEFENTNTKVKISVEDSFEIENISKEKQDKISREIVVSESIDIKNNEMESINKVNNEESLKDKNLSLSDAISEEDYETVIFPNSDKTLKSYGELKDLVDTISSNILDIYSQSMCEVEKLKILNAELSNKISESRREYKIMTEEYLSKIGKLRDMIDEKHKIIEDQNEKINSITFEMEEYKKSYDKEIDEKHEEIHNLKQTIEDFSSIKGMLEYMFKRFKA